MLRLLGAALVVGGLGGIGFVRARALETRLEELDQLRRALTALRGHVAYTRTPASLAFEAAASASGGTVGAALQEAVRILRRHGCSAGEAWAAALARHAERSSLLPQDRWVLADFCRQFGRADSTAELAAIDRTLEQLAVARSGAADERERLARLFRFSGVAAGLGLVILLL